MAPMRSTILVPLATLTLLVLAAPVRAQQDTGSLPVTRCDPAANTCAGAGGRATAMGPAGQATVLPAGRGAPGVVVDGSAELVSVPGCTRFSEGTMLCGMLQDYQHCRTLMISAMVESCRIEVAFASGVIDPREAAAGSYELSVESNARVRINREEKGFGQMRGTASVELTFDLPVEATPPAWCLQRSQYLYYSTGPKAGLPEIEDAEPCDVPLTFNFKAHADDLMRAWNLCETFAAWDEDLEDSIEVLAAAVFHIRSSAPEFAARYPEGAATIAPYTMVKAPLTIECRS
jgi:hypothetical protein